LGKILNFLNTLFVLRFQFLNNKNFIKYFLYLKKINSLNKKKINNKYKNQKLNINQIKKIKKTNEVFIYGSGYSINEISNEEWRKLRNYDSIGFNNTIFLKKISFTYHINRYLKNPKKNINYQIKIINKNRYLKKTTFLMPEGFIEEYTNNIFSKNLWDKNKNFFLFKTNRFFNLPIGNINVGLIHKSGTLIDCITFAYYLGYKKIVLVGVDLYDTRYFYVPKNKTSILFNIPSSKNVHGNTPDCKHQTIINKVDYRIRLIKKFLTKKSISLEVYNKKSLLKRELKLFKF
jgi:hypothetical protein